MKFNRHNTTLVSLLLPTRGRPFMMNDCLASFVDRAHKKSNVEIIIKLDNDDPMLDTYVRTLQGFYKMFPVSILITPRLRGCADLHTFVNHMGKLATGDWIMPIHDDLCMETKDWDVLLENVDIDSLVWYDAGLNPQKFCGHPELSTLRFTPSNGSSWFNFPLMRSKAFKAIKHVSLHPEMGEWMFEVSASLHAAGKLESVHTHHRNHETHDEISKEMAKFKETLEKPAIRSLCEQDKMTLKDLSALNLV